MASTKKLLPALVSSQIPSDTHPFGVLWLDSLFQEAFLPNGAWQKVLQKVNIQLAEKIKKQFDYPERKQMIFELMGHEFVQMYFPQEKYNPTIIEPPAISPEERRKLQVDAQNWLQKELLKVAAEVGCERPLPAQTLSPPSAEMQEFLRFVRYLATRNMTRHLYLMEKEVMRAWENFQWEQSEAKARDREIREKVSLQREYERLTGMTPVTKSILRGRFTHLSQKPPGSASSILTTSSLASNKTTANIKGAMYGTSDDPPTFWGMQSNSVGRSIVAILKRDPRRFGEVAAKLHGRQLPSSLRMYLWLDVLLRSERERLRDSNVEKLVRERFGKALSRGISDLRIKRATHSPISGLIDNAVIEIYDNTPGMRMFLEYDQHMKESAKALNIIYVYDRTYEPYLIHWLFPIQMAFQDFSGQSEHAYDLAMYLDLLNKSCFPKWPAIFAVAERVMSRLKMADEELHNHLETISLKNININPKEFLVQLIHEEKAKAQEILATTPRHSQQMSKELLANPRIFLRKWVGEGFASILDTQAVLYVWDQCFLQHWNTKVLEDFSLALLLLLRHKFLEAADYPDMRHVFLKEPCKLYTVDIQRAWVHIQRERNYEEVHPLNRQAYRVTQAYHPIQHIHNQAPALIGSPVPSVLENKPVPRLGLKHLRLHIDIPTENLHGVDVVLPSFKLECSLYFGSVQVATEKSTTDPTSTGLKTDKYGSKSFDIIYPKQKFVFDSFDTSQYDIEEEMGGYPFIIIQVTCDVTEGNKTMSTPLGWARLKLHQHKSEVKGWADPSCQSQWLLLSGDIKQRLSVGNAAEHSPAGRSNVKPVIGHNSWLNMLVYDPNNEPPTPAHTPTPEPLPVTPPPPPTPKQRTPTPAPESDPTDGPGLSDTFVLYIDGVDNIPDNATITKVTGRVIKTGAMTGLKDILALPELTSLARCPRFRYRYVINKNQVKTDVNMILLLRVYTVDRISGELKVIGSCLSPVYSQQTSKVFIGGHQKVLHYGMPDLKRGMASLTHLSLDKAPCIPGCTIFYRWAAYTEDHIEAPALDHKHYRLDDRDFNDSELRVIDSYKKDKSHPKTILKMITLLQKLEDVDNNGLDPLVYLEDRLDQKKHLPPNKAAGYLELKYMVYYRLDKGVAVQISRAYGLPEGLYYQCFAHVYAGIEAQGEAVTEESYGRDDEQLVTLKTDMDSYQTSPQWTDPPKVLHPHVDGRTFLMVQLFGLAIKYTANPDHKSPGKLTDKTGEQLKIGPENIIGWTVVPLFDDLYSYSGQHHAPLFKGPPDADLLIECTKRPLVDVIRENLATKNKRLDFAAVVVNVWDGHFKETELLEPIMNVDTLLRAAGDINSYKKREKETHSKRINQFILDGLTRKERRKGTSGSVYDQEKAYFSETIEKTFYALMEDSLMNAGYGPL